MPGAYLSDASIAMIVIPFTAFLIFALWDRKQH